MTGHLSAKGYYAAANLTVRNRLRLCALSFAVAVTAALAAEPRPSAKTVQNLVPTDKTRGSGELVKRLQRKPIPTKPVHELFGSASWQSSVKPAATAKRRRYRQAPPVPYAFMGRIAQSGKSDFIFLTKTRTDEVYTVTAGDVLDDIYRVDEVATDYIALTYLPLKMKQILSFREGAAASESGIAPTSPRDTTEPGERYRSLSSEAGADGGD